ncbi:UvrD-helicase domain-containing protein [Streptomonospora litoralis]|uniref:DNA 3'-5' helicase n=1 Tax=Streptomonospora litoralis TaxID=2498135 RepID=A0A4P6Q422_9ACTN|nr:UvrD-helicase domain-containing protein [Streptomonospora litoralis]QBI53659.1 DNA-dependent helicase II [Streptomonospora litoralis]
MPRLAIDRDFLREYARLEKHVQDRVEEVFAKFDHATHAGLHLEKILHARDQRFRTIRIDKFWRGVVIAPDSGDIYTLLKVMPHDDAYTWARRRTASVNTATGRIEIRDSEAIDTTMPHLERMASGRTAADERLFGEVSDADMHRLGVDPQTLALARALTDPVQLEAAQAFLPPAQWEVLYGLASGMTPEAVWEELGAAITGEEYDPEDLDAAVRRSPDRVVLVDGPRELMAVFARPFDLWRVYLHPLQREAAEARHSGPARVTGGPGTGKTVVALHRARALAERGEGPVLVTTFTSTLAESLAAGVKVLAETPEVLDAVTVEHVDRLAHRVFREVHGPPRLLSGHQEREMWTAVVERTDTDFSPAFLSEEWRQVILAQQVESADDYLRAKRTGRGRRLGAAQKARVWQAVCEFRREMREQGAWTHETVCEEAARILAGRDDKPYRHVIVDEAQDLSAEKWRLLRAAVPAGPDDLFIAGDTHQRIYQHRISFRDVGVHIAGRSRRLRVNYRTTAEILGWSLELLHGERIDDMDGGLESVAGCRSEVRGFPPQLTGFANRRAELRHLADSVREWLDSDVEAAEIGVAARSNRLAQEAADALAGAGLPARMLSGGQAEEDAVSVGTMHRMKGLEFRCLAVVGADADQVPAAKAVTPESEDATTHAHDTQRERCLLFVACTRARELLNVTWQGEPSPFLPSGEG